MEGTLLYLSFNPILTSRPFHPCHLDESILSFRGSWWCLHFYLLFFCIEIPITNRVEPDQVPHFPVSEQDLHCLQNTPKGEADLKRVKQSNRNN